VAKKGTVDLSIAPHNQSSEQGRSFILLEEHPDFGKQVFHQPDHMQEESG
jgi:hypothetical protein